MRQIELPAPVAEIILSDNAAGILYFIQHAPVAGQAAADHQRRAFTHPAARRAVQRIQHHRKGVRQHCRRECGSGLKNHPQVFLRKRIGLLRPHHGYAPHKPPHSIIDFNGVPQHVRIELANFGNPHRPEKPVCFIMKGFSRVFTVPRRNRILNTAHSRAAVTIRLGAAASGRNNIVIQTGVFLKICAAPTTAAPAFISETGNAKRRNLKRGKYFSGNTIAHNPRDFYSVLFLIPLHKHRIIFHHIAERLDNVRQF